MFLCVLVSGDFVESGHKYIDVIALKKNGIIDINNSFRINVPECFGVLENTVEAECCGNLTFDGYKYDLSLSIKAKYVIPCARCLKNTNVCFDFTVHERYTKTSANSSNEEETIIIDNKIELYEAVQTGVILEIPVKTVCAVNCKGLCSICGKDLNSGECDCVIPFDPRLESLASIKEILFD